jgi:adenine-specific DNA-methyltransferase
MTTQNSEPNNIKISSAGLKSAIANNNSLKPNSNLIQILTIAVPQFFDSDGNFKRDKFDEELEVNNIAESHDGYKLCFGGKDYARLQTGCKPETMIIPDIKHNSQDENKNSKNIFITGENLEVLRHLQNAYAGKIKMIYIDPPYNSGKEFVYNDTFEFDDKKLKSMLKYTDVEIKRLKLIQGKSSHSAWLTFMYPRLKLARKLLTEDGVICVSIDDNEQANLKLLMDEIFGEGNFIIVFNWQTKKAAQGMTTENMIVDNHEYIIVYAKQKSKFRFIGLERNENNGFSNPDNDPRGLWKRQYLQRIGQGLPIRTIIDPKNGNKFSFETPYTQEKLELWIKENRIIFPKTIDKYPARKEFLNEYKNAQQLVSSLGLYATKSSTEKLYALFDNQKVFTNPKPDNLILNLLKYTIPKDTSAFILDFFAGSGTTAHAVLQLNADDNGNRKFILVQLDEPTNPDSTARKAGYQTIDDIARERIKRAAKKIKTEKELALQEDFDTGFKHYRIAAPNVTTLDKIEKFDPEQHPKDLFDNMLTAFDAKTTGAKGEEVILQTWLINDGYTFDQQPQEIDFDGYQAYHIDNSLLYLINQGWGVKQTLILLNAVETYKLNINTIIVYGYSFAMESLRELELGIEQLIEKQVIIERRY